MSDHGASDDESPTLRVDVCSDGRIDWEVIRAAHPYRVRFLKRATWRKDSRTLVRDFGEAEPGIVVRMREVVCLN